MCHNTKNPAAFAGFFCGSRPMLLYNEAMNGRESDTAMIHLIMENNLITPAWFANSLRGLEETAKSHKTGVSLISDIQEIPSYARSVVVVGTNRDWVRTVLDAARKRSLRPILIGAVPGSYGEDVSGTMYGSRSTIEELVRYFHHYNRRHIALTDINQNSTNDCAKYDSFLSIVKVLGLQTGYSDVYFKDPDSHNPTALFLNRIRDYDGVICSNDYSAGFILTYCRDNGIRVPEDLFVAGLGDMAICRYTRPSLTSATRSYYEAGVQVYHIFRTLSQNPEVESIVTTMKSSIKPRGSTANLPVPPDLEQEPYPESASGAVPKLLAANGADWLKRLEACLNQCDGRDLKIIAGILNGISNETLAETLNCSVGTVNYRLKNLYRIAGVSTKGELSDLIRHNLSVEALIDDASKGPWE